MTTRIPKHEMLGINYLVSIGYKQKDIRINSGGDYTTTGTPDLTTLSDNQYWEVKRILPGMMLSFTSAQLSMDEDTNILVFKKNGDFVESIKFGYIIKDATHYRSKFAFNLGINDALTVQEHLGIDKCDYNNILRRFGMFHRNTRTFGGNFSSMNITMSTDIDHIFDLSGGTFIKLKDECMGYPLYYYVNDEFVGSSCDRFDHGDGDIITIRVSGINSTKILIEWLKDVSNTVYQHKFGDKSDEFSFTLNNFPNDEHYVFNPVVFINDVYVADLSDGDTFTIKATGADEICTLARCFEFAAAELEMQRIVNTLRYINSERNGINNGIIGSLIPPIVSRQDIVEEEFVSKMEYIFNDALHNLMCIECKEYYNVY